MHEWALAQAVIQSALDYQKKKKLKRLKELSVAMGELQQIDRSIFNFALNEIIHLKKIKGLKIKIRTEKAVLVCRACDYQWDFSQSLKKLNLEKRELIHFLPEVSHVYIKCPHCQSSDFEITKGRGVALDKIK